MSATFGSPRRLHRRTGVATLVTALVVSLLLAVPTADAQPVDAGAAGNGGAAGPLDTSHADRVAAFDAGGGWAGVAPAEAPVVADLDVPGAIPGELIVTTRTAAALDAMTRSGWQALDAVAYRRAEPLADRVALVTAQPADVDTLVAALAADDAVVAIEPNVRREYLAVPNDTSVGLQWAHQQTNAAAAWDNYTGQGGLAPLIAILDSGVDATHPDLSGVVVASLRSANGGVIQGAAANDPCGIGHGTAVAGSAAAQGNNGFGVTGVLWQARVIDIALTSPENGCPGGPADSDTITAMNFVTQPTDDRPWALNLSLGASLSGCSAAYQAAVDQARAANVVVVAAAGNDGTSQTSIPASCDGVISVGATNSAGGRASYSQTNPQVDIAAPGGDAPTDGFCPFDFAALVSNMFITTSLTDVTQPFGPVCGEYSDPNGHRLQGISGTSFASPYITGVVGLLRQFAQNAGTPLSVDQVEAVIEGTAVDVGIPGRDCEFGWGIV
ncbi:MAG TPA: S8 family serine peptidase, partial [Euzebya sp.]|nr:S8 family serine peptidase [Euzebya sp.]